MTSVGLLMRLYLDWRRDNPHLRRGADYLLTHLPRDMRTLAAAVDALDGFALAHKRPLTVPLIRQWLAADQP